MSERVRVKFIRDSLDVEGHSADSESTEIEVDRMKLETADGDVTLEPQDAAGEKWKVTDGPDDLMGHCGRWG